MTDWTADILFWGVVSLISVLALSGIVVGGWLLFGNVRRRWQRVAGFLLLIIGGALIGGEYAIYQIAGHLAHM